MAKPIFLTYDREALDREYNNRAKVARSPEALAWYVCESEAARRHARRRRRSLRHRAIRL